MPCPTQTRCQSIDTTSQQMTILKKSFDRFNIRCSDKDRSFSRVAFKQYASKQPFDKRQTMKTSDFNGYHLNWPCANINSLSVLLFVHSRSNNVDHRQNSSKIGLARLNRYRSSNDVLVHCTRHCVSSCCFVWLSISFSWTIDRTRVEQHLSTSTISLFVVYSLTWNTSSRNKE
jgi:hypothetical protein